MTQGHQGCRRGRLLAALLVVLAGVALAEEARAEDASADELLEQARAAYKRRAATTRAREAVDLYEKAIDAGASADALWEGARAIFFLGEFPMGKATRAKRVALYDKGIRWAKAGVEKQPGSASANFWLGSLYGVWGQANGILKSLSAAGPLRRHGEKAMKIDPNVECAGSFRLLGRYYHKVPRIAGGDRGKALKMLHEGMKRCPGSDLGRLYFAEALIDDGQEDRARANLEKIVGTKTPDRRFRAEFRFVKRRAQKMLDGL